MQGYGGTARSWLFEGQVDIPAPFNAHRIEDPHLDRIPAGAKFARRKARGEAAQPRARVETRGRRCNAASRFVLIGTWSVAPSNASNVSVLLFTTERCWSRFSDLNRRPVLYEKPGAEIDESTPPKPRETRGCELAVSTCPAPVPGSVACISASLLLALQAATAAGEWATVAAIARELRELVQAPP